MNSTRAEKIKELHEQLEILYKEDIDENRAQILPYLQSGKVTAIFNHYDSSSVRLGVVDKAEVITVIQDKQDRGYHHFGAAVTKNVEIRYDDGEIRLFFKDIEGLPTLPDDPKDLSTRYKHKMLNLLKELKIPVSFADAKEDIKKTIAKYTEQSKKIADAEAEYLKA